MIYRRGKKKTYWFRFRFAGRIVHESTKSNRKDLARRAERQRRLELEQKWNHLEKRQLSPTFAKASKQWLANRTGIAEGTRETYGAALKQLQKRFGNILLCEIETKDVVSYQDHRVSQSAAGATV